jgi:catechol 2,3-dioxygenase-like lactoylglutathione lyase family enzyme
VSTALPMTASVRFHLSLNVSNLERSIAFYRILFGLEPAKKRVDYAKFELEDPPLVLSLEPTPRPSGGPLNHLGFRMPDSAALVAMQQRLELAGIRSQREQGVECCYARQTKFWVTDPDRTLWEIYTLEEDLDHRGAGQSIEAMLPDAVRE